MDVNKIRSISRLGCVLIMLITAGCSYTLVRTDGTKYIIGLVSIKMPAHDTKEPIAGDSISVTGIGLSIYTTPLNSGIALGYNRESITALRQNTVVLSSDFNLCSLKADDDAGLPPVKSMMQEVRP